VNYSVVELQYLHAIFKHIFQSVTVLYVFRSNIRNCFEFTITHLAYLKIIMLKGTHNLYKVSF